MSKKTLIICFGEVPISLLPRHGCRVEGISEAEFAKLLSESEAFLYEERFTKDVGQAKDLATRGIHLPSRRIEVEKGKPGVFIRHLDRGEQAVVLFISGCNMRRSGCSNIEFEYRLITA